MLNAHDLDILSLIRVFRGRVSITLAMILLETSLLAFVPLFMGFAIDGLLAGSWRELQHLASLMAALVAVSVFRRLYDTRAFGTIRVELGKAQVHRSSKLPVSALNARVAMGRELVDFLEHGLPDALSALVQLTIAIVVLYSFSAALAQAAGATVLFMALIYALFHGRFYRLNGALNNQVEKQVSVLERRSEKLTLAHLSSLRRLEVRLSDTEAVLYGGIFTVLLGFVLFNLWFAAQELTVSVGAVFSIISYSWDLVEGALALPITLQTLSRLSDITRRLNARQSPA